MKVVLIIVSVVSVGALFVVGGMLWTMRRTDARVTAAVKSLEKDFTTGFPISSVSDRAMNLGAGGFHLRAVDPADPSKEKEIAGADRRGDDPVAAQKFSADYEAFQSALATTPAGRLVLDFPVVLNARWVMRIGFIDGKITSTESVYLD